MKQIPDQSVDMILCDPPYGIDFQSMWRSKEQRFSKIANDKQPFIEFIKPAILTLKETGCMLVFTRWDVQSHFIDEINAGGAVVKNIIIWDKKQHGMGDWKRSYGSRYESIIFAIKPQFLFPSKRPVDVIQEQKVSPNKLLHPNEKPVKLMQTLINQTTSPNDMVMDCCMGVGSTGVACVNTNRNFIGMELDEKYFKIAKQRIEKVKEEKLCQN